MLESFLAPILRPQLVLVSSHNDFLGRSLQPRSHIRGPFYQVFPFLIVVLEEDRSALACQSADDVNLVPGKHRIWSVVSHNCHWGDSVSLCFHGLRLQDRQLEVLPFKMAGTVVSDAHIIVPVVCRDNLQASAALCIYRDDNIVARPDLDDDQ